MRQLISTLPTPASRILRWGVCARWSICALCLSSAAGLHAQSMSSFPTGAITTHTTPAQTTPTQITPTQITPTQITPTEDQIGLTPQPQSLGPPIYGTGGEQGIIKLDVVVTDKAGSPVAGLPRSAFTVLDNGQPNPILAFHGFDATTAKANPPVEVILFFDSLDVPPRVVEFERQEIAAFLRQNSGQLAHRTSVYGISPKGVWQVSQPSTDGNVLADQLVRENVIYSSNFSSRSSGSQFINRNWEAFGFGSSPTVGAAQAPAKTPLQAISNIAVAARQRPGRKLLLWIGNGCCRGSGAYLKGPTQTGDKESVFDLAYWTSTLFREAHLTIYAFSEEEHSSDPTELYQSALNGPKSAADATWMSLYKKTVAVQSGGRVLRPELLLQGLPHELSDQINNVLREADTFYMLSIDASHADHPDEYHTLEIKVQSPDASQPALSARTKAGYYDQPYYIDGPNPALKRMTVAQVDAILKEDRGDRDAELAKQLSYIELTERMTSARLRNWTMVFRGKRTRAALTALSDASAFLDPPQEDILNDTPPDLAQQQKMLALVSDYLANTIPHLPNFFATRTTIGYEETPELDNRDSEKGNRRQDFQPLHLVASTNAKATVLYRNGSEVAEAAGKNNGVETQNNLVTRGTFGPLLAYVSSALATPNAITWSRWERGPHGGPDHDPEGRRAVFHWAVPENQSTYRFGSCCLPDGAETLAYHKIVGYFAEISIDPDTGAILRFELKSEFQATDPPTTTPASRADIMIEYGAVEVAGIPYICPVRSVTLTRPRTVIHVREKDQSFLTYGPYATLLNDVTFDDYHRFRSDSRILTDVPSADTP